MPPELIRCSLFFLESRVVGSDASGWPLALLSPVELGLRAFGGGGIKPLYYPGRHRGARIYDGLPMVVEPKRRGRQHIPADQGERRGVAWPHVCRLAGATIKPKGPYADPEPARGGWLA